MSFQRFPNGVLVSALLALSLSGAAAHAGENNVLFIEQDAVGTGIGNTLFVDQSSASDSLVAGDLDGNAAALQRGGNTASVTLDGIGAAVALNQVNPTGAAFNTATIEGGTLASILIDQQGVGNNGTLNVGAGDNTGQLFQIGNGNTGVVSVDGQDSSGTLRQVGNDNTSDLVVSGTGVSVDYTQNGNGLTSSVPAQVFSNAGTVTITQTRN